MSNRSFKRAHSTGMATNDILVETKKLADCVNTTVDPPLLRIDVEDITIGTEGLATESKQEDQIALLQGKAPALNRTEAIPVQLMVGSTGSNYDALRASGQDLMVMIDDMNPDVAINSGLARSDKQDTLNASLASVGTDQLRVDIVSGGGGDATAANQLAGNASLATIAGDTTSLDGKVTACNTGAVVVSSSALPAGASTADKQPEYGTAGTAAADVLSVQGIASMTPLVVDGSASTQPVSGTVTANAGTGTFAVSASALPLPSGASTSALQTTGNASLATIAGDTTSLDGKVTVCNTGAVVVASGDITETNSTAILADTGSLDTKIVTSAPVSSDGTTTAQTVNLLGTNDGTNFRTVKVGDGGAVNTEIDHSWDNTNVLINNVAVAASASTTSTEFDLGQGVSHEIGRLEIFVDNSAGVELDVTAVALHTTGGTEYFPANGGLVNSSETAFTFSQEDVGLTSGHRFMKFDIENKDGLTSTNVTLRVAYYK